METVHGQEAYWAGIYRPFHLLSTSHVNDDSDKDSEGYLSRIFLCQERQDVQASSDRPHEEWLWATTQMPWCKDILLFSNVTSAETG